MPALTPIALMSVIIRPAFVTVEFLPHSQHNPLDPLSASRLASETLLAPATDARDFALRDVNAVKTKGSRLGGSRHSQQCISTLQTIADN